MAIQVLIHSLMVRKSNYISFITRLCENVYIYCIVVIDNLYEKREIQSETFTVPLLLGKPTINTIFIVSLCSLSSG